MRFSEAFGIKRTHADDWFDPHLIVDTKLFIDPLLLLETGGGWAEAHHETITGGCRPRVLTCAMRHGPNVDRGGQQRNGADS